ncbi:MAG: hypothetical protein H6741_34985 [Alphaproteobacteria bacterium]|nr:hypothetical protein [Alphaproteobacteria bacterium]
MRPLALLLWPLVACADPSVDGMTAEDWSAHLSNAAGLGIPEPLRPRDTLVEVLRNGDGQCPAGPTMRLSYSAAFGGCEASTGWVFAGLTEYTGEPPANAPAGSPFHLLADGYIIDPEDNWFILGGELELAVSEAGWVAEVTGSWSYPPAGAWMAHEASVAVWILGDAEGAHQVDGGVNDGEGDVLFFDALTRAGDELDGAVELRDSDGRWTRLDLDAGEGACGELDGGEALCADALLDALDALSDRLEGKE